MEPFTERYVFTGPHVAISCDVKWDMHEECYLANGSGFFGTGHSETEAVLSCFTAWLTNRRAWYKPE